MPPFSSIKRSIRRRRRKLANRKKRVSNPAARKRNRRKRWLRPEHRVLPFAPSAHFIRLSSSLQLPPSPAAATTLSARHYGSIFGTAISQARNDFDDDEFRRCILSNTISTSYGTQKIVGTEAA